MIVPEHRSIPSEYLEPSTCSADLEPEILGVGSAKQAAIVE